MEYPNRFDTPTFPAGKSIALSRWFSVWILTVFFIIICACACLLFVVRQKGNYPFLISVDPLTSGWTLVAYPGKNTTKQINQYQIIQEKLVMDYVTSWFTISDNMDINNARWAKCESEDCSAPDQYNPSNINCALFCASDDLLFKQFSSKVLPEYHARIAQGAETWTVSHNMDIKPTYISENSSLWQVYTKINSSINGNFEVLIFITLERDIKNHPATLGYYVHDFNSYRMPQ